MSAAGLVAAIQGVVDTLVAADISAALDPADLNLPGVLVKIGTVRPEFMDGSGTVEVLCYLTAGNTSPLDALTLLDGLLAQVDPVIASEGDLVPVSLAFDNGPSCPALQLTTLATYKRTED